MEFSIALGAVVLGILIALSVRDWWGRRRKRTTFRPLHRMRIDAHRKEVSK